MGVKEQIDTIVNRYRNSEDVPGKDTPGYVIGWVWGYVKDQFLLLEDRIAKLEKADKPAETHHQNHHLEHVGSDAMRCTRCKRYFSATYPSPEDLCRPAKAKRKIVRYVNIHKGNDTYILGTDCGTREAADNEGSRFCKKVACKRIEIEFEEGEFDD